MTPHPTLTPWLSQWLPHEMVVDRLGRWLSAGSVLWREHRRHLAEMQHAAGQASCWRGFGSVPAMRAIDPFHGGEIGGKKIVALGKRSDCGSGIVTSDRHKGTIPKHG
jgi:hypothetical protein